MQPDSRPSVEQVHHLVELSRILEEMQRNPAFRGSFSHRQIARLRGTLWEDIRNRIRDYRADPGDIAGAAAPSPYQFLFRALDNTPASVFPDPRARKKLRARRRATYVEGAKELRSEIVGIQRERERQGADPWECWKRAVFVDVCFVRMMMCAGAHWLGLRKAESWSQRSLEPLFAAFPELSEAATPVS